MGKKFKQYILPLSEDMSKLNLGTATSRPTEEESGNWNTINDRVHWNFWSAFRLGKARANLDISKLGKGLTSPLDNKNLRSRHPTPTVSLILQGKGHGCLMVNPDYFARNTTGPLAGLVMAISSHCQTHAFTHHFHPRLHV